MLALLYDPSLLQDHDVYITDWHNARDVPLRHGAYGLDDYIDNVITFGEAITADTGHRSHWVAVCQPCVAALAATVAATTASLSLAAAQSAQADDADRKSVV